MEVVSLCLLTLSLTANAFLLPHHRESCGLRLPVKEKSPAGVDNITTYVTARDGTQLYTLIFFPSNYTNGTQVPVVINRSPYGADNEAGAHTMWTDLGFGAIFQDMRGRYNSAGNFSFWRYCGNDSFDTMQWVVQQPWSNGQIFSMGISADGIAESMEETTQPPWLLGQLIEVATADLHPSVFINGAFRESLIEGWLTEIGEASTISVITAHEAPSNFWEPMDLASNWARANVPAVHYGGWFDIFAQGTYDAYKFYQEQGGPRARGTQYLVMDPLGHCHGGQEKQPDARTSLPTVIANTMFDVMSSTNDTQRVVQALQDKNITFLTFYVSASTSLFSTGNFWVCRNTWPQVNYTNYYFQDNGELSLSAPTSAPSFSSYAYDPLNPVPTLGGANLLLSKCGSWDQSSLEKRSDVLTFTSETLLKAVAITGQVSLNFFVSSTAVDTDFMIKLTDVHPLSGKSMLVQDSAVRMRWRNESWTTPQLMSPNTIYQVEIDLFPVSYIFNAGHKIRVDVSSSNFPRFSINPNNGQALNSSAAPVGAINSVFHDTQHPSYLALPVVDINDLTSHKCIPPSA